MNTPNNKRSLSTEECLKNTLIALLKDKELVDISVTELCDTAEINRSTFYEHYEDVFSLGNACAADIEKQLSAPPSFTAEINSRTETHTASVPLFLHRYWYSFLFSSVTNRRVLRQNLPKP